MQADGSDPRGYRWSMTQAHGPLPGPWEDTDGARVVHALRRSGPLPMRDLNLEPEFVGWSAQRLEHAVIAAWSRNLIYVDQRDLLVAI